MIKLIAKVILDFEYHICTSYRVSKKFYKDLNNKIGGLGQGNVFSGVVYRDISCLIIKVAEKKHWSINKRTNI